MKREVATRVPSFKLGWLPELIGLIYAIGLVWFLRAFSEGFI